VFPLVTLHKSVFEGT